MIICQIEFLFMSLKAGETKKKLKLWIKNVLEKHSRALRKLENILVWDIFRSIEQTKLKSRSNTDLKVT